MEVLHHAEKSEAQIPTPNRKEAVTETSMNCQRSSVVQQGSSPTMRHVSRTHRVASDWLFDSVNLDPKIQIRYTDTKNQVADMLTKSNFTRDEWAHLLRLFNIMNFSMFSCSHFLSNEKPNTVSKRAQERRTGKEPVVAKNQSQ